MTSCALTGQGAAGSSDSPAAFRLEALVDDRQALSSEQLDYLLMADADGIDK